MSTLEMLLAVVVCLLCYDNFRQFSKLQRAFRLLDEQQCLLNRMNAALFDVNRENEILTMVIENRERRDVWQSKN